MPDTPHTDNAIENKDTDTILTEIPAQLFATSREGHYLNHVTSNTDTPYKDKIRALLSTYFRFYKVFTANNICTNFAGILRTEHNEIYLLLVKIFTSFTEGSKISEVDKSEICKLLDGILEHNISDFNVFTSIELYQLIVATQNNFIEKQNTLQQKHQKIVDDFKAAYLESGISSYSKNFASLCLGERVGKYFWLVIMALCSSIFLFYFVANIFTLQQISNLTFTKLVIYLPVTVLAFLILTWLGRRYAACREQEITYKHLATILKTYKTFQENLDDTNKGLLILETARVVTAIPKPLAKESPSIDYSKIVDIIKIMDKKG